MDIYELADRLQGHDVKDIEKMLDLPDQELADVGICVAYMLPDDNLYISGSDNLIIPVTLKDPEEIEQVNIELQETDTGLYAHVIDNPNNYLDSPNEVDGDSFSQEDPDWADEFIGSPDYKENVLYVQNNPEKTGRKWNIGTRFPSVTFLAKCENNDWCRCVVFQKSDIS